MLVPRVSDPLNRVFAPFDRLFDEFFASTTGPFAQSYRQLEAPTGTMTFTPPVDLWEADDHFGLEMDLPGCTMEDIEVLVKNDVITIRGNRNRQERGDVTWHRWERPYGQFERTFRIPFEIDRDKVEAHFKDGVLFVRLPKVATAVPRKVEVKVLTEGKKN